MQAPQQTTIRLNIIPTLITGQGALGTMFGFTKQLFSAPLMDANQIHILAQRPTVSTDALIPIPTATRKPLPVTPTTVQVNLEKACREVSTLTLRAVVTDEDGKVMLANKATEIKAEQIDHCRMVLKIGGAWRRELIFSFSVDGQNSKLRVARTSGWIEVTNFASILLQQLTVPYRSLFPFAR